MFGYWRNPFAQRKSVFFYALHKSGSSFVHTILHRIHSRLKYQLQLGNLVGPKLDDETYYGPIRLFETISPFALEQGKVVIQIRDPRDILTSLYFSMRYSHAVPSGKESEFLQYRQSLEFLDIDDFVIREADRVAEQFLKFRACLNHENVLLLHYEEMVNDFDSWFDQVIEFLDLTWNFKLRNCLTSIRDEADFDVESEDVHRHKRQVAPGDHLRKLLPTTIDVLNRKFEEVFEVFYSQSAHFEIGAWS